MANSRLEDIYRKELMSKGFLGAFISASGARIREKTDIRGMLPQTGISGAAFEKMFGKKYRYGASGGGVRSTGGGYDSDMSKSMEEKLTRLGFDMKIMAKNSVVFPAMARDINVMRLNMQKLVKLAGGSPTKSADMFFKRAGDREAQYEGQYKKNSGGLTPTPVDSSKKEGGGIFDLFKFVLKAGLLTGLLASIGKYFEGGEFKKSVDNMLNSIFTTIFGEDYKKNILDGAKILGGAILAIKAGFVIFELAIAAATRKMFAFAAGAPGGGAGAAGGKKGGKFGGAGKFALLLGAGLTTVQIYEMFGGKEQAEDALGEKITGGETLGAPGAAPTSESVSQTSTAEKVGTAASLGLQTAFAASMIRPLPGGAASTSPTAAGKSLSSFGTVGENREMTKNKGLWKKIIDVITKVVQKGASVSMVSKFSAKFGFWAGAKFATVVAGVAAAPFSAGFSLLVSALGALLLVYDVYQIYDFFVALEKEMDEDEKNSAIIREESATAITPSSTATQVSNAGGAAASVLRTPTRNAGGAALASRTPSPASGDSRTAIEDYLGRKINDQEHDMLMRAVYAEASANKNEYANVMAVILNRTRKNGGTIIDTLSERNAFQAVTGTSKNGHQPSPNFIQGPNEKSAAMINESASSLPGISKSLDSFSAANRNAYGPGTSVAWLDKLQAGGGTQIGQTVFAENMYRGGGGNGARPAAATALASAPNTGNALLDIFAGYTKYKEDSMKQGGGSTVVNAPVTNIAQNGGGGGSGSATPYNTDMMKYLLRPVT
jgi:hypothetical protein